jgi:hypothetical protein
MCEFQYLWKDSSESLETNSRSCVIWFGKSPSLCGGGIRVRRSRRVVPGACPFPL